MFFQVLPLGINTAASKRAQNHFYMNLPAESRQLHWPLQLGSGMAFALKIIHILPGYLCRLNKTVLYAGIINCTKGLLGAY